MYSSTAHSWKGSEKDASVTMLQCHFLNNRKYLIADARERCRGRCLRLVRRQTKISKEYLKTPLLDRNLQR